MIGKRSASGERSRKLALSHHITWRSIGDKTSLWKKPSIFISGSRIDEFLVRTTAPSGSRRPTVIARKVSDGSQAEEGAKTREVLMSVLQTLKKRVADPRQRFKEMLDQLAVKVEGKVSKLLFHADDG